jgi:hypothetical protein
MPNLLRDVRPLRALCLVGLMTLANGLAAAQSGRPDPFLDKSAGELLQAYNGGLAGSLKGQEYLFGVLDKGLPANDANIAVVRNSLFKAGATDDKVLLMKVLTSMYTPRVRTQANLQIESDVKKLIASGDKRLATAAVFEYSRLAYPTDRYAVLQQAHASKVVNDDSYFGELAHGLRFSTPQDQTQMLDELDRGRNGFGAQVLAATFGSREALAQLSPAARGRLLQILSSSEPGFPMALDSFGSFDVIRYAQWLAAVATMESTVVGNAYADVAMERLTDPRADPRKILAFFGNPEGQRAIAETKDRTRLRVLLTRAQGYANSLPQNIMLNGAADAFSKYMTQAGAPEALRN